KVAPIPCGRLYNLKNLRQKEEEKMNKYKILGLSLVAFIGLMGFNELAFAAKKGFVPPAWYQKLPASERFQLVLDNAAVLDKETGLVWEKSPDTTTRTWTSAIAYAYAKNVGNRKGWRLPTVEELASLVDPTQNNPALPSGHPFTNVQSLQYWSASTFAGNTSNAWYVHFLNGDALNFNKLVGNYVWCVRGGHGHDGQ
ncbi:MAG: DUF1566 domain-containing protein, partial [Candidatus Brocadiaceae bacterium]|nr:DUF1566 domain-containing protein [Candidatus Brocadiaceae bacterium]